jgi:NCAIR mutase (PurE)-related protein
MTNEEILILLESVRSGEAPVADAAALLGAARGYREIDGATLDTDRLRRTGYPEVIYCASKSVEQIIPIARALLDLHGLAFGTRCAPAAAEEVMRSVGGGEYDALARTIRFGTPWPRRAGLSVGVIAAGTSDLPVAEEAVVTLETFGARVERIYDVGVAGLHRLLGARGTIDGTDVLIVVAGMEGALPSVVGGLTRQPLIAVPTSVGYGTALGGFTALFGMLTSCASGITVVNIDNGFGAAMAALSILGAIEAKGGRE